MNENINFQFNMSEYNKLDTGFSSDSLIETKNKAIKISEILLKLIYQTSIKLA